MVQIDRSGHLKSYAAEAATAFVDRGEPLSEKIASIVRDRSLTGEQAATVCKFANLLVFQSLRSGDSMVEFKIADPEKVAALARGTRSVPAMVHKLGSAGEDCSEWREKVASLDHETTVRSRSEIQAAFRDLEHAKLACQDGIDAVRMANAGVVFAFEKLGTRLHAFAQIDGGDLDGMMCQIAQYQPLARRPELLAKVAAAVKAIGELTDRPVTFGEETMGHLSAEGMAKNAEEIDPAMVTPGLSIGGMPVAIVRGSQQVWVEIDSLIDQYDDLSGNKDKLAPMQDRVRYLRRVVEQSTGGSESTLAAQAV